MTAPRPPSAPQVVGRYLLYGEIAAGGMATVHLGRLMGAVGFSRTVAIKRLHAQFASDPEFVAMFLDEAHLAARIRHPNVVSTIDVVSSDGCLLLVMEYVQGESLSRLVRGCKAKGETIPLPVLASIMTGMLSGLHAAHEATNERGEALHIVHRDVSPQNVLAGTDGGTRVLDFGIAKAIGRAQATREGQVKGKIAYLAPEQILGTGVDRRTDVYAASVVMWEALTLRRFVQGDNDAELMMKAMKGSSIPPSAIVPGLPPELDGIVMKGLARDPEDRWETATAMARAVEDAILLASPRVVGEWVEHIAADLLAERAQRVADVESGSETKGGEPGPARPADVHSRVTVDLPVTGRDATVRTDMATGTSPTLTVSATSASRTRASPRSPRVAWLVAGAALAVAGASALLGPGRALVAPAADAVPSVKPPMATPGLVAGSAPVDSTPLAPNAAPESSASATAPVAVPSPAPGSTTSGRAVLPAPRRPLPSAHDCTPPYYFGADGTKRYKGQCL